MSDASVFTAPGGETHREIVRDAALFLDERWPGEELGDTWYDSVDLRLLEMSNSCRCVCGQLGARLARHEGYVIRTPLEQPEIDLNLPRARGDLPFENVSGFGLMILDRDILQHWDRDRQPTGRVRAFVEAELELVELLRKRLEVEEGEDRVIPDRLRPAFWAATPTLWWAEEIETRRRRGTA